MMIKMAFRGATKCIMVVDKFSVILSRSGHFLECSIALIKPPDVVVLMLSSEWSEKLEHFWNFCEARYVK